MSYIDKVSQGLCRSCLNETYGTKLRPEDCRYLPFPSKCPKCDRVCNIVTDVKPLKRWKLYFKKEKK